MESALSLDTTFLIDLQKEHRRKERGAAFGVLESHPRALLCCSVIAWGEFLEGLEGAMQHPLAISMRAHVQLLPITEEVAEVYAAQTRILRASGWLPGANDLWIASVALEREQPLVTRNGKDFKRIPDLRVMSY